eukprot:scaffold243919_cov26-Tisochrysis_lutea.AAC.1
MDHDAPVSCAGSDAQRANIRSRVTWRSPAASFGSNHTRRCPGARAHARSPWENRRGFAQPSCRRIGACAGATPPWRAVPSGSRGTLSACQRSRPW